MKAHIMQASCCEAIGNIDFLIAIPRVTSEQAGCPLASPREAALDTASCLLFLLQPLDITREGKASHRLRCGCNRVFRTASSRSDVPWRFTQALQMDLCQLQDFGPRDGPKKAILMAWKGAPARIEFKFAQLVPNRCLSPLPSCARRLKLVRGRG